MPEMQDQYGDEKGKQVAFAVATQMSHRLGKSPKTFKSEVTGHRERFGTSEARTEAKKKFDKPLGEYRKTAALLSGSMRHELEEIMKMAEGTAGTVEETRKPTALQLLRAAMTRATQAEPTQAKE